MKKTFWLLGALTLLLVLFLWPTGLDAQCIMCSAAGEANLKEGGRAAAGLNKGILYMLALPYIMATIIGYLWWRNLQRVAEAEREAEIDALLEYEA